MNELAVKLCSEHSLSLDGYERLIKSRTPELAEKLAEEAVAMRKSIYGNDVYVRGLIEISSYCKNDRFMSLCKSGQILNCCHPNALMTLTEYLVDYAAPETRDIGYALIEKELEKIPNPKVKSIATQNIADIRNSNRRDFRF